MVLGHSSSNPPGVVLSQEVAEAAASTRLAATPDRTRVPDGSYPSLRSNLGPTSSRLFMNHLSNLKSHRIARVFALVEHVKRIP